MLVSLLPTFVLAFVLPRVAPPSPAARAVVLALDNLGDGDESEEVELYDGDSQSSLPCFLAGTISVGGATYGALHPVNLPVSIATYEDDELIEALLAELEGRAGQLKSHHYAQVFHQLHKIDHPPAASFTAAMVEEVTRGAHLLSGSLVRNVLTACAGLDIEPGDAFLAAVKARHAEVLEEFRFVPWLNDALQAYSELLEFPLGLIPEDYDAKVELLRKIVQDEAELF